MKQMKKKSMIVMLAISVAIIVGINLIPDNYSVVEKSMESQQMVGAVSEMMPESIVAESDTAYEPLNEVVVSASSPKEPMDIKSIITWAIAALNGIALLIGNIKKLFSK